MSCFQAFGKSVVVVPSPPIGPCLGVDIEGSYPDSLIVKGSTRLLGGDFYVTINGPTVFRVQTALATINSTRVVMGGTVPDLSALLTMTSTTLGFLPPVMTTVQRDAIAAPATGLQVFSSTTNTLDLYYAGAWHSTLNTTTVTGIDVTGTLPAGLVVSGATRGIGQTFLVTINSVRALFVESTTVTTFGATASTPTLRAAPSGAGVDQAATDVNLAVGAGTGAAANKTVHIQANVVAASGAAVQTIRDVATFADNLVALKTTNTNRVTIDNTGLTTIASNVGTFFQTTASSELLLPQTTVTVASTPTTAVVRAAPSGAGANQAAGELDLSVGAGTGNAPAKAVKLRANVVGAAGVVVQTIRDVGVFADDGSTVSTAGSIRLQTTASLVRVRVEALPAASGNLNLYQQGDQGKAGVATDTLTMNLEQRNGANVITTFAQYQSEIVDATSTLEYGAFVVRAQSGGTIAEIARFYDDLDSGAGTITKTLRFAPTDSTVSTFSAIRFQSAGVALIARIIAEGANADVTIAPNDIDSYSFTDVNAAFLLPLSIGPSATNLAALQVNSTTQTFLPPRQTTVQRTAMGAVDTGSIIFNTTTNAINVYYGGTWHVVTAV